MPPPLPDAPPDSDGLPPGELKRSWRYVMTAGGLGATYYTLCIDGAPRVAFLDFLHAGPFDFGLISAMGSLALAFQILGGVWANRVRRRKPLWIALMLCHRAAYLGVIAAPLLFSGERARIWCIIAALFVHNLLANLGVPMWFAWMADLLPKDRLSRLWARRQRFTTSVSIVAGLLMAVFFMNFEGERVVRGYTILCIAGVLLGLADICLFFFVPEAENLRERKSNTFQTLLQPLRDPEFRPFLLFRAYWQFSAAIAYPFFGIYLIGHLQVDVLWTQILFLMGPLGIVASTRFWGLLCDTYGQRPILILLLYGKAFIPLAFLLAPPIPAFAIPFLGLMLFLDGTLNSAFELSNQGYILKSTPRANRSMYIAANNFFSMGITAFFAPLLAGKMVALLDGHVWKIGLYAFTGYHAAFGLSALLRAGSVFFASRLREPGSLPVPVLLRHLRVRNPLRVTRHIYRLSEAAAPEARVRAARKLGALGSPLAIRELIRALQDPFREVRHAAADALGRIGTDEATTPLADALCDPASGIQSPAARALGRIGGFHSLQALLRNLSRLDADSLGETVDSLGRIGDSAAILPLICLFTDQEDPALRRRIAAALARLDRTQSTEQVLALFPQRAGRRLNI